MPRLRPTPRGRKFLERMHITFEQYMQLTIEEKVELIKRAFRQQ